MPFFRPKLQQVEAIQFTDDNVTLPDAVQLTPPEMVYDAPGEYIYVISDNRSQDPRRPGLDGWISVATYASEEACKAAEPTTLSGFCGQIKYPAGFNGTGADYWRVLIPFAMTKVKEGKRTPVDPASAVWRDFAAYMQYPLNSVPYSMARYEQDGKRGFVPHGAWIILKDGKILGVMTPEGFANEYEPC